MKAKRPSKYEEVTIVKGWSETKGDYVRFPDERIYPADECEFLIEPEKLFKVGNKVYKPKGYKFDATIVSVFKNLKGDTRLVAENADGLLHIFNSNQLDLIK